MQTERLTKYLADRLSLRNQVLLQEFSRFIPTGKITIYGNSRVYGPVIITFLNDNLAVPTNTLQKMEC